VLLLLAGPRAGAECRFDQLHREERTIEVSPAVRVFVMRVATPVKKKRGAVVFTHGSGSGGSASWDLRAQDYSLMRALACAGFDTYAFDARGFGGSTMPPELSQPAESAPPVARAAEVIEDLDATVRFAMRTSSVAAIDLVGWSWGADVAGMYAGLHSERIEHLVLMSPVYDRRWPERHKSSGAWYPLSRAELEKLYAPDREERAVWDEFVASLFRFSKSDVLHLPSGPLRDIYGEDAPVWDAHKIRARTLVLRGEEDKASLEQPAKRLLAALENTRSKRYDALAGMGHFLFRERRHRQAQSALLRFLTSE
jgi:pimeloyl-ACP methyl ester carboxylesterase